MTASDGPRSTDVDAVVIGAGFSGLYMLHRLRDTDGPDGAGLRDRRRRRRHLVLEPLPGRPQRLRQLHLRLHLRRTSSGRSGSGVSATRSSTRSAPTSSTWPSDTTSTATSRSTPRVTRRHLRRGQRHLDGDDRHRGDGHRPLPDHRRRARCPRRTRRRSPASTRSAATTYHTGLWPHEKVDFTGKRVGVIGTGRERGAGHPADRPGGRPTSPSSSAPPTTSSRPTTARCPRRSARRARPTTPGSGNASSSRPSASS